MEKSKGKGKFYAVAVGRNPGVYGTWAECQRQTKGFSSARFKSFPTRAQAEAFVQPRGAPCGEVGLFTAADVTTEAPRKVKRLKHTKPPNAPTAKRRRVDANNAATSVRSDALQYLQRADLFISIYFDGGSRGNPGIAGAGAEVTSWANVPEPSLPYPFSVGSPWIVARSQIRHYCGSKLTNNVAEYTGLLVGLQCAHSLAAAFFGAASPSSSSSARVVIRVRGDSNLIINQMKGTYTCKSPSLLVIFQRCRTTMEGIRRSALGNGSSVDILFEHVYRESNKVADALANEAMDERRTWTTWATNPNDSGAQDIANDDVGGKPSAGDNVALEEKTAKQTKHRRAENGDGRSKKRGGYS